VVQKHIFVTFSNAITEMLVLLFTAIMMRIEDAIIKTLISVETPIATACKMFMPHKGNCFGMF